MSELPTNPSESLRKRNPHLYPPPSPSLSADPWVNQVDWTRRLVYPAEVEGLNNTETRYYAWLKSLGDHWIGIQCLRFRLAEKCWFLPDFIAIDNSGLRAIDVKACWKDESTPHVEDDAMVKIKVAAKAYPWCRFILAYEDGQVWRHKEIKP